jgi:hypothetical protein
VWLPINVALFFSFVFPRVVVGLSDAPDNPLCRIRFRIMGVVSFQEAVRDTNSLKGSSTETGQVQPLLRFM